MKKHFLFSIALIISLNTFSQVEFLQSGPMVGYSTMKEVLLWAQTSKPAKVYFKYWDVTQPTVIHKTKTINTIKENAYVAKLIADELEPGNHYEYTLYINDTEVARPYDLTFESQPIWLWRGDAPDFSFATGSGAYINETKYDRPGKPFGSDYKIYTDIYKKHPNFMLWLGDNVYLREADWNSKTGILHRYTHTRSTDEMQAMFGSMHHYAIWDDHDFGPNDSDRSFAMKKTTEQTFKLFFPNPNYIFKEGTTGFFQWADCEFFLLDNRYWRTPNKRADIEKHQLIGEEQLQWLLDALANSYASFKFIVIGGQFLNPLKSYERHANLAPAERLKIIQGIERLKINGVIFLTGDVHYTELSKLDLKEGYPLYDLTVSPLTSGVFGKNAEANPLQVKGTLVRKHNYALLKVTGTQKDRKLEINIYDKDGKKLWSKLIKSNELKFKDQ
jgi:alkaline phosphatase D